MDPWCDSHSPSLLNFFLSSGASICSTMACPPLGNADHVFVSVFIDFPSNSKRDVLFFFCFVFWEMSFEIIWEMFHWRISLNSIPLLLLVNFLSDFNFELISDLEIISRTIRQNVWWNIPNFLSWEIPMFVVFLISKDFFLWFRKNYTWLCERYDCIVFSYNCMLLSFHVHILEWIHTLNCLNFKEVYAQNRHDIRSLSDSNKPTTHNWPTG